MEAERQCGEFAEPPGFSVILWTYSIDIIESIRQDSWKSSKLVYQSELIIVFVQDKMA